MAPKHRRRLARLPLLVAVVLAVTTSLPGHVVDHTHEPGWRASAFEKNRSDQVQDEWVAPGARGPPVAKDMETPASS